MDKFRKYKRIFVIVTDSLGIGELPDSELYGDKGTNTFKHLSYSKPDFSIKTMQEMGVGNICDINNTPPTKSPIASTGIMRELSKGKDTLTGHWEMMGLEVKTRFPSFTDTGFPKELVDELERRTGHKFICNESGSGTEFIKNYGERQLKTKEMILYTSADSVLQIAASEELFGLDEIYRVCEIARQMTLENPDWMVGRVIARPFVGNNANNFTRTANRHDYAVKPFGETVLVELQKNDYSVISVGKIKDIFVNEGITEAYKGKSNHEHMEMTIDILKNKDFVGLCFVNLVDFDSLYGHRRNPIGYANCVEEFDKDLTEFIKFMKKDDLLIITADHGNDPTHTGFDHTREHVPLIVYNKYLNPIDLGLRQTFSDIGATISDNFNIKMPLIGTSFLKDLKEKK